MMDACSTLIKNSHLIPLELQVRSIFESYFYIRYIECEKGKAEERSLAYLSEFDEQPTRLGDKMKMNDEKWERLKKEKDRFLKE